MWGIVWHVVVRMGTKARGKGWLFFIVLTADISPNFFAKSPIFGVLFVRRQKHQTMLKHLCVMVLGFVPCLPTSSNTVYTVAKQEKQCVHQLGQSLLNNHNQACNATEPPYKAGN